jgi:type II secretory pathway pseudopilin PulG
MIYKRHARHGEAGFTLAGVIVLVTIMMVFVAYTVPRQWTAVMARERDRQTIFVMKQYARAIADFQKRNGGTPPTSLDQLKDARRPRYVRGLKGEWIDPWTGKVDWILVPPQAPGTSPGTPPPNPNPNNPPASSKDYVGPFVGVRPNKTGQSLVVFNGQDQYENWFYTVQELQAELAAKRAALLKK